MVRRAHVIVRGRVQGVGYRAWTEQEARARGLGGWVRNRRDGTVEAVIAGDEVAVGDMLHVMREGPAPAIVEGLSVSDWTESIDRGFEQRPTI
jgi:acylphosphatase